MLPTGPRPRSALPPTAGADSRHRQCPPQTLLRGQQEVQKPCVPNLPRCHRTATTLLRSKDVRSPTGSSSAESCLLRRPTKTPTAKIQGRLVRPEAYTVSYLRQLSKPCRTSKSHNFGGRIPAPRREHPVHRGFERCGSSSNRLLA